MPEIFSILGNASFDPDKLDDDKLLEWQKNGGGLYASNGAVLGILKRSSPELADPDLFIFGLPLKFHGYEPGYSKVRQADFNLFTWAILKAHTQNTGGTVRLASKDPLATPEINFNYFGSGEKPPREKDPDLDALVEGVRFVRKIAEHAGVADAQVSRSGQPIRSEEETRAWIKREAWGHHACGTCRMGRATDPDAVTDSRFHVLGDVNEADAQRRRKRIKGLRVVDASIFPNIPGYFIVANIYMASEKAADDIHRDAESNYR